MIPTFNKRLVERITRAAKRLPLLTDADVGPFVAGVIAGTATVLTFLAIFFLWWAVLSLVLGLIGPASDEILLGATACSGVVILIVWALLAQWVTSRVAGAADKPSPVGRAVGFIGTPIFLFVVLYLGVALVQLLRSMLGGR